MKSRLGILAVISVMAMIACVIYLTSLTTAAAGLLDATVTDPDALHDALTRSKTIAFVVVVLLVVVLGMALVVTISSTRRVRRLTRFATKIASGDRPEPLDEARSDELGELARALDAVALRSVESAERTELEVAVLEMIAAGRPLADTLGALGSLTEVCVEGNAGQTVPAGLLEPEESNALIAPARTANVREVQAWEALVRRISREEAISEERATLDELTGLLNRRSIIATIDASLDRQSDTESLGILSVDLDEFKSINDRYGHAVGDEVLVVQARRIAGLIESLGGDVGRLGGDEFLAVLPSIRDVDELMLIGERIVHALGHDIETSAVSLDGAASVGGAIWRFGVKSDQLLHEADVALHQAKSEGKQLAVVSTPRLRRRTSDAERLKTAVRSAIDHDEFRVHYQPVWRVVEGEPNLRGFEALVRWDRPGFDLAGPSEFLGIAEELRLMARLDYLIFRRVCNQLAVWTQRGITECTVSVNISPSWIEQPDFVAQVAEILAETGCDPTRLVAELTEETVMTDIDVSRQRLGCLGELGLRIAVDDFGQGHSSLAYLRDLPIDELKADRRFIAGVDREPRLATIVATIRDLAKALDLRFIAEGVERQAEFDCLVEIGCELIQGFWAGYPMTPSEAETLVEQLRLGMSLAEWREIRPHLSLQAGAVPELGARRRMVTDTKPRSFKKDAVELVDNTGLDRVETGELERFDELLPTYRSEAATG